MGFVWSIVVEMGHLWVQTLTSTSFLLIYGLLVLLVISQYRRMQTMSEPLFQGRRKMYLSSALISAGLGLLGGLVGSIILVILGVDLAGIAILQLWVVAIVLMLIQPRFLCFSYAAGVISVSSLWFGYPHVNIPQLMGLVAVLHLVESGLIILNGPLSPFPIYLQKQGQLRGGFNLQLFWPIPLIALLGVSAGQSNTGMVTPQWWPLLQNYSHFTSNQNYALIPLLAVLGYGEISTTQTPAQASRSSSLHLFIFSLSLLCLAVLASRITFFLLPVALFSPLGHELVVWLGLQTENHADPIYVPPGRGVMILDVLPGTPAHRHAIRTHDVILTVNSIDVDGYHALQNQLNRGSRELVIAIQRGAEVVNLRVPVTPNQDLGVIPVPEADARRYVQVNEDSILTRSLRKWGRKKK
ncbi:MAG: PDZ domain-containing protein [Firmicutes bacterium]|nr:PDZ domain-containing protein [Bacillota bacterium]